MHQHEASGPTQVLVVDDSALVRRLLAGRLRDVGCRVSEATDGEAALEEFRRTQAEVVVTDISMPRLDGLRLLAALRSLEAPPEVVVLTGADASGPAVVEALRLGAHDYLPKTTEALGAVVQAVVRAAAKRRRHQESARLIVELQRQALTDALTGVGNRRAFEEALVQEIARARRHDALLGLAMVDLDHFKAVNDGLGHQAGDELLAGFARRLRSVTRDGDRVFRFGGEEFAVVVAPAEPAAALAAAARIVRLTREEPFAAAGRPVRLTCSAGVSVLVAGDDDRGHGLVARADAALYAAKRAGRDRAVAFEGVPRAAAAREDGEAGC